MMISTTSRQNPFSSSATVSSSTSSDSGETTSGLEKIRVDDSNDSTKKEVKDLFNRYTSEKVRHNAVSGVISVVLFEEQHRIVMEIPP